MASDDVIVKLTAEISGLEKGMQKGAAAVQGLEKKIGSAVTNMRRALVALGVAVVAREFVQLADASTNLNARIKLVAGSTANAAKVHKELLDVANRTRVGFESVVTLYTRLGRSADALGISQSRLLKFTETFSQALKISGATTAEASATVIQLSQALGSGYLRGQELNSVLEQGGRAATALAEGLGVPIGELKKLGERGELTAAKVIAAIESQSETIQKEFNQMPSTVGDALTVVQNKLLNFVGKLDSTSEASRGLVKAINELGALLDDPEFADNMAAALAGLVKMMTAFGETIAFVVRQMERLRQLSGVAFLEDNVAGAEGYYVGGRRGVAGGGIGGMPGIGVAPGSSMGSMRGSNTPLSAGGSGRTGSGSGTRNAAADAIKREQAAIEDLISDLQFEISLVGQSAEQQAVMNNLRRLGSSATEEQRVSVEAYTRALSQAEAQQRLIEETAGAMGDAVAAAMAELQAEAEEYAEKWQEIGDQIEEGVADAFLDIVTNADSAGEAIGRLIEQMGLLIAKALILEAIQGITQSVFGAGGTGGSGGLGAVGGFAAGGTLNPGNAYQLHKNEVIVPHVPMSVIPAGKGMGGGNVISISSVVNVPGGTSRAEFQQMLNQRDRELVPQIINAVDDKVRRSSKYATRR